jgi:superfamily II DNA/RNA helicase
MRDFHAGRYDVLIQVKKASEGFDAPTVSVLLKLDAVFSREPVIQQLGRGLRFNHRLPESQNLLNVFIGRDPRFSGIIEHLEREMPPPPLAPKAERLALGPDDAVEAEDDEDEDEPEDGPAGPEIVDVTEAGDAYLDHTGRFVEGQQLTFFGVSAPKPLAAQPAPVAAVEVVDLHAELRDAIDYCKTWTNRAARARGELLRSAENHHATLNLLYAKESGKKGTLNAPEEYRAKGDWMRRQYSSLMG